jgi:hypothetical protein
MEVNNFIDLIKRYISGIISAKYKKIVLINYKKSE